MDLYPTGHTNKKKYFVLVRSVVTYKIAYGINLAILFSQNLLQEKKMCSLELTIKFFVEIESQLEEFITKIFI